MKATGSDTRAWDRKWSARIVLRAVWALCAIVCTYPVGAQSTAFYQRTLTVGAADVTTLNVSVPKGELQIFYSHEGQLSITASRKSANGSQSEETLPSKIALDQDGNHVTLRVADASANDSPGILYRIDVPYRTVVTAAVADGRLAISGVLGPVRAETGRGNIDVSYVSQEVTANAKTGSITLQVIGARADAKTGSGNISGTRAPAGIAAETADGDINLTVVGPSVAIVKSGIGRINIGGARGSLVASTEAGELHVKAIPHDEWHLRSKSGAVNVELPGDVKLELDAASTSGSVSVEREDIPHASDGRSLHEQINGSGPRVEVRSDSGRISIR